MKPLLLDRTCPNLWQAILDLFATKLVIVVGTSLRDPSIIRLFTEASDRMSGFFVAPYRCDHRGASRAILACDQSRPMPMGSFETRGLLGGQASG